MTTIAPFPFQSMENYQYLHTLQDVSFDQPTLSEDEFLLRQQLLDATLGNDMYDRFLRLMEMFCAEHADLSSSDSAEQFFRLFLTVAFTDKTIEQVCLNDPRFQALFTYFAQEAKIPFVTNPFPYLCAIYVRGRELSHDENNGSVRYRPCKEAPTQVLNWIFDYCDYLQYLCMNRLFVEKLPDCFVMIDLLEHYPLLQQLADIKCSTELIFYFILQKEERKTLLSYLQHLKEKVTQMEIIEKQWQAAIKKDPSPLLFELELENFAETLAFFKLQTRDNTFVASHADLNRFCNEVHEEVKRLSEKIEL